LIGSKNLNQNYFWLVSCKRNPHIWLVFITIVQFSESRCTQAA
jgi:hypothetical protein